jgi:uncharacterized peroxidase-related enzyme
MTVLTTIDPATAEPKAKALLDGVQKKLGMTPNMMRVLAVNPTVLGAYLGFAGALAGGRLGAKLHEQIALAVAEANGCNYCLAAHTLLAKGAGVAAADILAARRGTSGDARAAAALALAHKLVAQHGRVSPEDVAQARAASLSDADIVEVVASVAINVFTNYLNIAADTDVDFPPVAKLPANA